MFRRSREAEPRDAGWADPMEQLLRQHIATQMGKHPVGSLDVACRPTLCRIKATGKAMDSREVATQLRSLTTAASFA